MLTIADVEGKALSRVSDLVDVGSDGGVPPFLAEIPLELLNEVFLTDLVFEPVDNGVHGYATIVLGRELELALPGLEVVRLVVGGVGGTSVFQIEVIVGVEPTWFRLRIEEVPVTLRVDADILRPLIPGTSEPDPEADYLDITLGAINMEIDSQHGIVLGFDTQVRIPDCEIGQTGILLSLDTLRWTTPSNGDEEASNVSIAFSGDDLDATFAGLLHDAAITIDGLRVEGPMLPGGAFAGDARVVLQEGVLQTEESYVHRHEPDADHLIPLDLKNVHFDRSCFALTWNEPRVNYWLEQLAPDLFDANTPAEHELTLRVVFGDPLREIRLDWALSGAARKFTLPGVDVTTPDQVLLSLLLGAGDNAGSHLALCLTFDQAATALTAESNFAWEREEDRELHNDDGKETDAEPLLQLSAKAKESVSLVLLALDLDELKLPHFLRQLETPIIALDYSDPTKLCEPTAFQLGSLEEESWEIDFEVNAGDGFTLPFLKQDEDDEDQDLLSQLIKIDTSGLANPKIDFVHQTVSVPVGLTLCIGSLEFATVVDLSFNWETLALNVDHDRGLELYSEESEFAPEEEHLGLRWRLKGTPITDGPNKGKFHFFTLATKDYNYQIQQAPGSTFEVDYTRASDEPITFSISDFALTPKGLNVTATVTDRPARLNGLDTRFRFSGSRLEIKENRILDFTLSGSGPLPPALVGDSTADISLQFSQRDGALRLVAGSARLKGNKLLDCRGTRFRFSVDGLGLRFVDDGKYHLYFLITGTAQFVPAPSDDPNGPLALLPNIKIELVECPLTGDASVIAKHVRFLTTLPKTKSFNFFGCFEMELRGIGFVPQAEVFDGDGAMVLTGQLKFAQGAGDTADSRVDVHTLYIGLPAPGTFVPRLHFQNLPVNLNFGAAFRLNGTVEFIDTAQEQGFSGEGVLEIQGLPTMAASFSFLRVRRDASWLRAWFIYVEVRKVSFLIPVVQLYLREVGLGFGYRYTLVSIGAADRTSDVRKLLQELKELSRTQGNLSKRDQWVVDLEESGQDPRWTIALRAMISQTSASPSPLRWEETAERDLASIFLLDAVIALRSDLTFLMAVRAWLNTNYHDFYVNKDNLRDKPLFSGFVLLSPRQKRLLANLSSNPNGHIGSHPPLPDLVKKAIAGTRFSATLLIEPGLIHYELGWPNMLGWSAELGPLKADLRGGVLFRISTQELVIGISYLARASLRIDAGLDLGLVGVRVSASADLAYGARFIGVVDFEGGGSALYGAMGLEARIQLAIQFWIRIPLVFTTITLSFRLSIGIGFTAGLEAGISGAGVGLRGSGTLSLSAMGHRLQLNVKFGVGEDAVEAARRLTERFLQVGLEATEVEGIPGVDGGVGPERLQPAAPSARASDTSGALASSEVPSELEETLPTFEAPDYNLFVIRAPVPDDTVDAWTYMVLIPQGERASRNGSTPAEPERGFLPTPPNDDITVAHDFRLSFAKQAGEDFTLERFDPDPAQPQWVPASDANGNIEFEWKVNWDAEIASGQSYKIDAETGQPESTPPDDVTFKLREYLRHAFLTVPEPVAGSGDRIRPVSDPTPLPLAQNVVEDERVHNPSDDAFEAAVRGAVEQFRGSPFFKRNLNDALKNEYERVLDEAFKDDTTVYHEQGVVPADEGALLQMQQHQQALQLRGMTVENLISGLREHVAAAKAGPDASPAPQAGEVAFEMGLVFRIKGDNKPAWLDEPVGEDHTPSIWQRLGPSEVEPPVEPTAADDRRRRVRTFNTVQTGFSKNPPQFDRVQQLTDANTIAIAWDLRWPEPPNGARTEAQADPEHHLAHYEVRCRALDGSEGEIVYTVKNAQALHRPQDGNGDILGLKPRFQVVDHFTEETPEDLASLPAAGRSYLYTIRPVDFAGDPGRPLTLVATRYPNQPPLVPTDAELTVRYHVGEEDLMPENLAPENDLATPRVFAPESVRVAWTEPDSAGTAPAVPVRDHCLVFRKSSTMPIGSYGLDSNTQGPRAKSLPTTNARPLQTDIKVKLEPQGPRNARVAEIPKTELRRKGILPEEGAAWRPESWRVFLQTVSVNGVPSALAPVQLLLRAETEAQEGEERRPAELEWLARPTEFGVLPPEDGRTESGPAHVPMPDPDAAAPFVFGPDLRSVKYQPHPAGVRCVRFRWNQGPSNAPAYPLELTAGYRLSELDVDAHTDKTFEEADRLAAALRAIQEIQMVPGEDLLLTPGDTLAPSQWEAWYPSAIRRQRANEQREKQGSEIVRGPWYSWRESLLEWPEWPDFTDDGQRPRLRPLHPVLEGIIDSLRYWDGEEGNDGENGHNDEDGHNDEELPTFNVDLQIGPPFQPCDLQGIFKSTAPKSDPYGWDVLQRFGLCVVFSLRREKTGEVMAGEELLTTLHDVLDSIEEDPVREDPGKQFKQYYRHLHVELLFQPGRSTALVNGEQPGPEDLLALVQLSLRPLVRQHLTYRKFDVSGPAGDSIDLVFNFERAVSPVSVIDQSDPASGQAELEADDDSTQDPIVARHTIKLPLNGRTTVLLRSGSGASDDIQVGIALAEAPDTTQLPQEFVEYRETDSVRQLIVKRSLQDLNQTEREELVGALNQRDKAIAKFSVGTPDFFPVNDERSLYFTVPETLAGAFGNPGTDAGLQWSRRFKRYAESLNSTDPEQPADAPRIVVPTAITDIAKALPDFLAWSQRFFDASGDVVIDEVAKSGRVEGGPWLATAYPRAGSPAYATPDAGSRLKYDHLLENPWAHAYRYYIKPYGRYDLLWQSVRKSPALFPRAPELPAVAPDPEAGGLDVVLERTRPVDMPLVLSSGRLDEPGTPGNPAAPGKTWEVIVAQHPEQALVERNATLARQLAFRQVAFTLLRRFVYQDQDWIAQLEDVVGGGHEIEPRFVQDQFPAIPAEYPDAPEHLDLGPDPLPLPGDVARSIDLPMRMGDFQQGALVLQWEALPFYYEHRLMLVAQTDTNASPANVVDQRDFEYRSPEPSATVEGVAQLWHLRPPFGEEEDSHEIVIRARRLSVPLQRFWDSLPDAAQDQWQGEAPDPPDGAEASRKLSSLPDPEVVYQVVELFSGNIEVQAELFFEETRENGQTRGRYACRQLGQRFPVEVVGVEAPPATAPQAPYVLDVMLRQVTQEQLTQPFDMGFIPEPTRHKIALVGTLLSVAGVLTKADRDNMLNAVDDQGIPIFPEERAEDRATIERLYRAWFCQEPVSGALQEEAVPPELADLIDFPEAADCTLVWRGAMSAEEREELADLPGDDPFRRALDRLATAATTADPDDVFVETIPAGPEQVPRALRTLISFEIASGTYTSLAWEGPLFDDHESILRGWARIPTFAEAVNALVRTFDERVTTVPLPDGQRPDQDALPEILAQQLTIRPTELEWRGRLHSDLQLQALQGLQGDAAFTAALQELVQALTTGETTVGFELAARPQSAQLGALQDKLLIGRALLRYHGLMSVEEARALQGLFELPTDKDAVGRLYASSLDKGMRGRQLMIRTRRGSATPSNMRALEAKTL